MFDHALDSPFASKPHSELKIINSHETTLSSLIYVLRVIMYIIICLQTVKMQPNAPQAARLVEKTAEYFRYW